MQKRLSRVLGASLLACAMGSAMAVPAAAQAKPESAAPAMPKVGDMAPDFKLNYFDGTDLKEISLSQYRGKKNVVVAFFVFAFTGG